MHGRMLIKGGYRKLLSGNSSRAAVRRDRYIANRVASKIG